MAKYSEQEIDGVLASTAKEMGYGELRTKQETVVRQFLCGRDVFVSLPTGSGKSLCYCILPRVFDKLRKTESCESRSMAVVVSPLIALMKDQVRAMTQRDVRAVYVGEVREGGEVYIEICEGKYQLIFMSPEALLTDIKWRDMLQSPTFTENLIALVINEAHCVKKW